MTSKTLDEYLQLQHDSTLDAGRVSIVSPVDSGGAINVMIQDQYSDIVDLHLTVEIDTMTILSDLSVDDIAVSVSCTTTPVAGNVVCIKESYAFYQSETVSVVADGGDNYTLALSDPLDFAFTTSALASLESQEMNVNGAATPVIFRVSPKSLVDPQNAANGQRWDITRMMLVINDTTAMDDGKFGGIAGGITNGITIRKKNSIYKNIFNAKTNGDFGLHAFDAEYVSDTLGPAGQYAFRIRRTFAGPEKNGVTIRLLADDDDEFQLIIRDDLTDLTKFHAVVQGHIVEN